MLDYKAKYKELKSKMVEATDLAYRLGMQKGMEQAQQQAQMQQMQQMQQMMMQPQINPATGQPIQGGAPGMGGAPMDPAMGGDPMAAAAGGAPMDPAMMDPAMAGEGMPDDEMDEHAQGEMDQYIQELEELVSKGEKPKITDIRASLSKLTSLRKSQKEAKVKQNTPEILSAQKKLVNGILQKWEKETKVTADNLEEVIKESGLKIE